MQDELPLFYRAVYMAKKGRLFTGKRYREKYQSGRALLWKNIVEAAKNSPLPPDMSGSEKEAVVLYSGGTTGRSKGVCLSGSAFNSLGRQAMDAIGLKYFCGASILAVMPIFHGFGLGVGIHAALMNGATCILVPQFSADDFGRLVCRKKPNLIAGVPTLFAAMLRTKGLEREDMSYLLGVFCGGDSLPRELKESVDGFLAEHGSRARIREGYGTTECVSVSCLTPIDRYREGSVGIPFPDMEYVCVREGTTEHLPPDTEGEICITGPTLMMGYLNDPEADAVALRMHSDGRVWLHTGDAGTIDREGFVFFRRRLSRMIISSGFNIYPEQVEKVIESFSDVAQCCVIGVADPYRMKRLRAYIILREGVPAGAEEEKVIRDLCLEKLPRWEVPSEYVFRDTLPKTLVGKVAYRKLEEEVASEKDENC